jgi:hypothetical protein
MYFASFVPYRLTWHADCIVRSADDVRLADATTRFPLLPPETLLLSELVRIPNHAEGCVPEAVSKPSREWLPIGLTPHLGRRPSSF